MTLSTRQQRALEGDQRALAEVIREAQRRGQLDALPDVLLEVVEVRCGPDTRTLAAHRIEPLLRLGERLSAPALKAARETSLDDLIELLRRLRDHTLALSKITFETSARFAERFAAATLTEDASLETMALNTALSLERTIQRMNDAIGRLEATPAEVAFIAVRETLPEALSAAAHALEAVLFWRRHQVELGAEEDPALAVEPEDWVRRHRNLVLVRWLLDARV